MKKRLLVIFLAAALLLSACGAVSLGGSETTQGPCTTHTDADANEVCDNCGESVLVYFNFYVVNDLHGKIADSDTQPGVDELTTYLKNAQQTEENVVILSSGDMWQGSSESNLTNGLLTTEWMNAMDFVGMVMGNHEYDWGSEPILENYEIAEFPFLAINIFDRATNEQVEYCKSSVMIEADGVQIGIIGAIGDCYSSISADKVSDIYFKTDKALTELVKAESELLRSQGADFIVYALHDGYEQTKSSTVTTVSGNQLSYYYDIALSQGYVDLVFEAHTHQRYLLCDEFGVYHLQNKGENKGISHVKIAINPIAETSRVTATELITSGEYAILEDDPIVQELLDKYDSQVAIGTTVLGTNATSRSSKYLAQLAADQYYEFGLEQWGDEYDIVLGGGFFSVRSPYTLDAGEVTYGDLQTLFPFDNELVLCSIKGRDLQSKFFETDNDRYYISYGTYGEKVRKNIDANATYYIVVDSYTSVYAPNKLTEIERYSEKFYARDLLAACIKDGKLE